MRLPSCLAPVYYCMGQDLGLQNPVHQFPRETYEYIQASDAHIPAINYFEALLISVESPGKGPRGMTHDGYRRP